MALTSIQNVATQSSPYRRQRRFHRRLGDANIIGILLWNAHGQITGANDALLTMIGYTREDLTANRIRWDALTPPEYAERDRKARAQIVETGAATAFEKEYYRSDGSRIHVLIGSAALDDESGSGVSYVLDVTPYKRRVEEERVLAELSQHALKDDLSSLMKFAAAAVRRALQSDVCRIFLHEHDELRLVACDGMSAGVVNRLADADSQVVFTFEQASLSVVENWHTEGRLAPSAALVDNGLVASATVAIGDDRGTQGVLGVYSRTPRRILPEELTFLHASANVLSSAISHTQAAKALSAQEQRLQDSVRLEALGRLAGGIAHDFNNLLTAILGYADLARHRHPVCHAEIQEICHATESASELVRQLLAFSRHQVLQPRRIDLNSTILSVGRILHRLIGENIDLVCTPCPEPVIVSADPAQIEQVLMNLALNARDAIQHEGRITISACVIPVGPEVQGGVRPELPAAGCARLTVTDTGAGMDERTRNRIFEPFFTTKEPGKGSGLGLATVYGIVQQSGGTIAVQSEPGRGSVFTIDLPRAEERRAARSSMRKATSSVRGTETVLLVEDDDRVRASLAVGLAGLGYQVIPTASPAEAIEIASSMDRSLHALVTDMVMPAMSGRTLANRIRELRPAIRTLFISGYPSVIGEEGADRVMAKPFTCDELASRLREAFDGAPWPIPFRREYASVQSRTPTGSSGR